MSQTDPLTCWYLTGPTASGKTSVGLALAARLDAEIISLDSMALYRGMDIGTAKPSQEEQAEVPHHLIDVIDPREDWSVARYRDAALATIDEIRGRGREVLFVGGTPLYLKAMLRGLFKGPEADWDLRRQLGEEARHHGPTWLHDQLDEVDPPSAARLHPNDTRRLVRALEVYKLTGRPISEWQQEHDQGTPADQCRVFALVWPRETLYHRIEARVDAMFAAGLVEEVRRLLKDERGLSRTAGQAVGYREVIEHLEGKHSLEEATALVKRNTRRLAKRQMTWMRGLCECRLLDVDAPFDVKVAVKRIFGEARQGGA